MNKKAQFFIISTVIMSVALTTIIVLLTVPAQLTTTNLASQTRDLYDFKELISNFKTITNSLYNTWSGEQGTMTEFTIKNNNYNAGNNEYAVQVSIEDYAEDNTFELVTSEGRILNAAFSQTSNGTLIITFTDDLLAGRSKKYYVYYNTISDTEKTLTNIDKISRIVETITEITYSSSNYEATIDKNTGIINDLRVEGNPVNLANDFGARVNSNNQNSMAATTSVESYSNNVLIINSSGLINANVYLKQRIHLHPNSIIINQDFEIKTTGTYNLSYSLDATTNLDSLAYKDNTNISLNKPSETLFNAMNYYTIFKNNTGISVSYKEDMIETVQTTSGADTRVQIIQNSYTPSTIKQVIILTPYYNNYLKGLNTGFVHSANPATTKTVQRRDYITYLTQPLTNTLKGSFNQIVYYTYNNITANPRTIVLNNKAPSNTPVMFKASSEPGEDLNTLELTSNQGTNTPFGVTTKNYHNSSSNTLVLRNDAGQGVSSTDYELINLDGEDFTITVNMNSVTGGDTLTGKVYSANNTLVLNQVLSPATPGSFEDKILNIKGYNVSGVYTLNLEGDNVLFRVRTTLPLISAKTPIILNNTNTQVVYFETITPFTIKATGLKGTSSIISLNNTGRLLFNKSVNLNEYVNNSYTNKVSYYLTLTPGSTLINSTINLGDEDYYLSSDYEIIYVIRNPNQGKNYYYINTEPSSTNKSFYYSNTSFNAGTNTLYNTFYSWDLDSETFNYEGGNNWLYNGDFYACTGTYGACTVETTIFTYDSLIEDTPLFKTALFTSNTIKPLVTFYNSSNLLKIKLLHSLSTGYTFGLNYRIEGDDDTYYKTSFTSESALGASEATFNSTQLTNYGWNYIGKRDGNIYTALIFKAGDVKQGDNVLIIDDDYLRIGLNEYASEIYYYISSDWGDVDRIVNSLNNEPVPYNEPIHYYYEYNSEGLKSTGRLIG